MRLAPRSRAASSLDNEYAPARHHPARKRQSGCNCLRRCRAREGAAPRAESGRRADWWRGRLFAFHSDSDAWPRGGSGCPSWKRGATLAVPSQQVHSCLRRAFVVGAEARLIEGGDPARLTGRDRALGDGVGEDERRQRGPRPGWRDRGWLRAAGATAGIGFQRRLLASSARGGFFLSLVGGGSSGLRSACHFCTALAAPGPPAAPALCQPARPEFAAPRPRRQLASTPATGLRAMYALFCPVSLLNACLLTKMCRRAGWIRPPRTDHAVQGLGAARAMIECLCGACLRLAC